MNQPLSSKSFPPLFSKKQAHLILLEAGDVLLGTVKPCIVFPVQLTHEPRYRRARFWSLQGLPVILAADWPSWGRCLVCISQPVSPTVFASHRLLCVGIHPLHGYARRVNKHWDTLALGSILIMMKNEDSRLCDSSSLSKDELAEVFTMARWCLTLCERSEGWGQRQLALLCLSAQSRIEAAHCQHSYPICLQLGTSKHGTLDKWSKPRCPSPCTEKIRQQSLLETKRLSINTCSPELYFSQSFAKTSEWYNLYLKEWQNCWNI